MELKPPSRFPPNRHPGQPVQVPLKEWATVDEKEEEEEKETPAPARAQRPMSEREA